MWQEDMQLSVTLSIFAKKLPDLLFPMSSTFPGLKDIHRWINFGSRSNKYCGEGGREGSKETEPILKKLL